MTVRKNQKLFYDAQETLSQVQPGTEFKNYRTMCKDLGIPTLTGQAKQNQLEALKAIFDLVKIKGNAYKTTKPFDLFRFHEIASGLAHHNRADIQESCYKLYARAIASAKHFKDFDKSNCYFPLSRKTFCEVTNYMDWFFVYNTDHLDYWAILNNDEEDYDEYEEEYTIDEYTDSPTSTFEALACIWIGVHKKLKDDFESVRKSLLKRLSENRLITLEKRVVATQEGYKAGLEYLTVNIFLSPDKHLTANILTETWAKRWRIASKETCRITGFESWKQASTVRQEKRYQKVMEESQLKQGFPEGFKGYEQYYLVVPHYALNWKIKSRNQLDWSARHQNVLNKTVPKDSFKDFLPDIKQRHEEIMTYFTTGKKPKEIRICEVVGSCQK